LRNRQIPNQKKRPRRKNRQGREKPIQLADQPQELPHEVPHEARPPPTGTEEVMEKPDRMPASTKSTLMLPQLDIRLLSTRKVNPS
jgi:hypothetical protein